MEQAAAILLLGGNAWTDLRRQRISIMLTAGIFLAAVIMRVRYGEYAALAAGMSLELTEVPPAWTGQTIGFLSGVDGFEEKRPGPLEAPPVLREDVLIFSGIDGERLDEVLRAPRENGISVSL